MKIQLLYFDECPNWQVADERLGEALAAVGSSTEVERVLVATAEEAEAWDFHGSPSILVDGEDPFAEPGAPVGLACRLYRSSAGVSDSPTTEQLVDVLARD